MEGKERDQRAYEKVKQHLLGLLLSIVLQVAKEMGDSYPVRPGLASMQLRGGICVSFPGAGRIPAPGLRWRFRVFLPPAAQGGSVGIRIAYLACFKTLPHVLTYTVQYWVVFINMFHTAHPICGMGQCNGPFFATCRLRNLPAGISEDAGVLENVTYLLVAPDMWHG